MRFFHGRAMRGVGAGCVLACCAGLTGCKDEYGRKIKGESVFDFLAPPTPMEAAAWAADPYDADKRYRGLLLLSNATWGGERVYLEMYRLAADDPDPGVRSAAISALAMHGTAEDAPLVARHIDDAAEEVRWHACRAMQRMYYPAAAPALLDRLKIANEPATQVRAAAARALGQYPEMRVLQGLIGALGERQLAVNEHALTSLEILTGREFGYDDRAWLRWVNAEPEPFADGRPYVYPVFHREKNLIEWMVPFLPGPPNEVAGPVIGAPASEGPVSAAGDGEREPSRGGEGGRRGLAARARGARVTSW
jgi:hypothetical protein